MSIIKQLVRWAGISSLVFSTSAIADSIDETTQNILNNGRIAAGFGYFGVVDNKQLPTLKLGYEFAPLENYWDIRPIAQVMGHYLGAYHISVGALKDFTISKRWSWGISSSVGYLHEDSSDDTDELGHDIEFYSTISATYHLNTATAIRAELGHISNASLGEDNPGSESLFFSYLLEF